MDSLTRFKVEPGSRVRLKDIDAGFTGGHTNHDSARQEVAKTMEAFRMSYPEPTVDFDLIRHLYQKADNMGINRK